MVIGQMMLKLGRSVIPMGSRSDTYFGPQPPGRGRPGVVLEVRAALSVRFWENFIIGKFWSTPD